MSTFVSAKGIDYRTLRLTDLLVENVAPQPTKASVGVPRFSLKSTILSMPESNKENLASSRRMNFTVNSSPSDSNLKASVATPKIGNPSLASTVPGKPGRDAGNLFKSNFGKSAFAMKQSDGTGKGLKAIGFSAAGVSSTLNKKRTLTQFQSEKFSLTTKTTKTTQPQSAFSLKPPLQAKMQSSKMQMLFSRTDNSAKRHASSFMINKSGSRPFALTSGKEPSRTPSLPNGPQKKALEESNVPSTTLLLAKESTALRVAGTVVHHSVFRLCLESDDAVWLTAAPALISPSHNSPYQRIAQLKPTRTG